MSCKGPSSVFDYIDSEGSTPDRCDFEQHMAHCDDCRNRRQFYSQLRGQIREGHGQSQLPELSRARLLKMIQAESQAKARPRPARWKVWGSGLAAAAGFLAFSAAAIYQTPASSASALATAVAHDHGKCCGGGGHATAKRPQIDPVRVAQTNFGSAPEVASFPDLDQVDCRICPLDGKHKALHVVYRSPSANNVVSMFGVPAESTDGSSADSVEPHMVSNLEHNMVSWRNKGWLQFLVSDIAPGQLAQIARDGQFLAQRQPRPMSPGLRLAPQPYDGLARPASFQPGTDR